MIADELDESAVHQNGTQDFELEKSVVERSFQKNLNDNQKAGRNQVSVEMLERLETEPDFLNRVIRGDGKLVSLIRP
jgi:fibronectin type 3 domain-containing protein